MEDRFSDFELPKNLDNDEEARNNVDKMLQVFSQETVIKRVDEIRQLIAGIPNGLNLVSLSVIINMMLFESPDTAERRIMAQHILDTMRDNFITSGVL